MTMNTNKPHLTTDIDYRLKKILADELPKAPDNGWFVSKVMNRLPERTQRNAPSIWQKLCYLTGILMLIGAWGASLIYTLNHGLSSNTLIMAAIIPSITILCIGILWAPAIKRDK